MIAPIFIACLLAAITDAERIRRSIDPYTQFGPPEYVRKTHERRYDPPLNMAAPVDHCSEPTYNSNEMCSFRKYAYNNDTNKCLVYTYGTCDDANRLYDNEADCINACVVPNWTPPAVNWKPPIGEDGIDHCSAPTIYGNCLTIFRKYYYNPYRQRCMLETYGTCDDDRRLYDTEQECLEKCP